MNYVLSIFLSLYLLGCGVDTDSSGMPSSVPEVRVDTNTTVPETNTTVPTETNTTETNTTLPTVPETNTTTPPETNTTEPTAPVFDTTDAERDNLACLGNASSPIPLQDNANSVREADDDRNGVSIRSSYPEELDELDSNVILYYNSIGGATLSTNRSSVYGDSSQFTLSYDLVWVTLENNTFYVKTPKLTNELQSCFKVTLNSEDGTSITPQKVFR